MKLKKIKSVRCMLKYNLLSADNKCAHMNMNQIREALHVYLYYYQSVLLSGSARKS